MIWQDYHRAAEDAAERAADYGTPAAVYRRPHVHGVGFDFAGIMPAAVVDLPGGLAVWECVATIPAPCDRYAIGARAVVRDSDRPRFWRVQCATCDHPTGSYRERGAALDHAGRESDTECPACGVR